MSRNLKRFLVTYGCWLAVVLALRLLGWTAVEHAVIAGGYYLIALVVLSTVAIGVQQQPGLPLTDIAIRVGTALFFLGCGSTHVDLVSHYLSDTPIDYDQWHHSLAVVAQEATAPFVAIVLFVYLLRPPPERFSTPTPAGTVK